MRRLVPSAALALSMALVTHEAAAAHDFDLADNMPPHLAVMFSMSWFGVPKSDPQPGGVDGGYGNWKINFPKCGVASDPATCEVFGQSGLQRKIASKRRPQAGIWSATDQTDESGRRLDAMLSMVRRPCDVGARLDAFAVQLDSVQFTSAHPTNQQATTWDIAYRSLLGFLDRADAAGMDGAVMVALDSTTYWSFGDTYKLTTTALKKAALTDDIVDMAKLAVAHPSARTVNGKPFLFFYVDAALLPADQWAAILDDARTKSGIDFYAMGSTLDGSYFAAFDALVPWLNLGIWNTSQGADVHARALAWQKSLHAQLLSALPNYKGRVMFGSVSPGFDDFTQHWGQCESREIPRDPALLSAQFEYLTTLKQTKAADVRGVLFETWDDWTEGSEMEPDVEEGAAKLIAARQGLGTLFGEAADPAGDAKVTDFWKNLGQARNCCFAGGACDTPSTAPIDLTCPATGAGGGGGTGGSSGGGGGGTAGSAGSGASSGNGGAAASSGSGGSGASSGKGGTSGKGGSSGSSVGGGAGHGGAGAAGSAGHAASGNGGSGGKSGSSSAAGSPGAGGSPASGGTVSTGGSGGGSSGAGAVADSAASGDGGACGCTTTPARARGLAVLTFAGLLGLLGIRRGRRR